MKKTLYLIIVVILFSLVVGCGFNSTKETRNIKPYLLQTENDVLNYLSSTYPDENFEIIRWEYQNKYTNARNWYIKSLDTNIEFKLYDSTRCYPPSKMGCGSGKIIYEITDSYPRVKLNPTYYSY